MPHGVIPRNRLAKPLPQEWRDHLIAAGVPKRKSIAVCRATLSDGRIFDSLIIQDGWIVATTRAGISGQLEERIDFDPRAIASLELLQTA